MTRPCFDYADFVFDSIFIERYLFLVLFLLKGISSGRRIKNASDTGKNNSILVNRYDFCAWVGFLNDLTKF